MTNTHGFGTGIRLHRWFDHWLKGIDNGVWQDPPVKVEREPGQFAEYQRWPIPTTSSKFHFGPARGGYPGSLASAPSSGTQAFTERFNAQEHELVAAPQQVSGDRLLYVSEPLAAPLRFSGRPEVTVRATQNTTRGPLSAMLVDLGTSTHRATYEGEGRSGVKRVSGAVDCVGQGNAIDEGCFARYEPDLQTTPWQIVTVGTTDTANRESLRYETPVVPGTANTLKVRLHTDDHIFPAGHRIAVVVYGTDCTSTEVPGAGWDCGTDAGPSPRSTFTVDLAGSSLTLPVAAR